MSSRIRARPAQEETPSAPGAPSAPGTPSAPSSRFVALLAVASGIAVADNYYLQPLLALVGKDLGAGVGAVGGVAALALLGYALGLLLVVPLGDIVDRRPLVVGILGLTTVSLATMALAPSIVVLALAAFGVGLTSVVAQVLVPYAASLADDASRGRVVGTVMSGILAGIVGARVVAGLMGQALGWRAVYAAATGLTATLLVVLLRQLPREQHRHRRNGRPDVPYRDVLLGVGRLAREVPGLGLRALYGACGFGVFSAVWTTLSFHLHDEFGLGPAALAVVALLGVGGAVLAPKVGKVAGAGHETAVTGTAYALLLVGAALLMFGGSSLPLLLVALIVIDLGVQAGHVANLGVVYALVPHARSRVTTVYMTSLFLGGATGSLLAGQAYARVGWSGVVGLCVGFAAVAMTTWLARLVVRAPRSFEEPWPDAVA